MSNLKAHFVSFTARFAAVHHRGGSNTTAAESKTFQAPVPNCTLTAESVNLTLESYLDSEFGARADCF